jgi:hypothetical protein
MDTAEESRSIALLVDRLQQRFPHVPPPAIRDIVDRACRGFAGARIRDFVPVLVEREALDELRSQGRSATPS